MNLFWTGRGKVVGMTTLGDEVLQLSRLSLVQLDSLRSRVSLTSNSQAAWHASLYYLSGKSGAEAT